MVFLLSFLLLAFVLSSAAFAEELEFYRDRIKALEVFKPMNPDFQFTEQITLYDTHIIGSQESKARKLKRASAKTWFTNGEYNKYDEISLTSRHLADILTGKNIIDDDPEPYVTPLSWTVRASEFLSRTTCNIKERMYLLHCLGVLQEHSPRELAFFKTDVRCGAVSRAGLELSLVKGTVKPQKQMEKTFVRVSEFLWYFHLVHQDLI